MSMSYHHKRVCATIRVNGSNQAHTQSKPYFVMPAHCASVSASKRRSSSAVEIPVWHHLSVLCASCCGALQCACRAESRAPLGTTRSGTSQTRFCEGRPGRQKPMSSQWRGAKASTGRKPTAAHALATTRTRTSATSSDSHTSGAIREPLENRMQTVDTLATSLTLPTACNIVPLHTRSGGAAVAPQ